MNVPEYHPPLEGSEDSADPLFRPRRRPCGYCGHQFTTSAGFRYYCERCRALEKRKHSQVREYANG